MEFLINNTKEVITCEGDFLPALVTSDIKGLNFHNCPYSYETITKTFKLTNKGINKVWFRIENSDFVKISPDWGIISEKGKQEITVSFVPSELKKLHLEQIAIHFKGSHIMHIPFKVNTL